MSRFSSGFVIRGPEGIVRMISINSTEIEIPSLEISDTSSKMLKEEVEETKEITDETEQTQLTKKNSFNSTNSLPLLMNFLREYGPAAIQFGFEGLLISLK